MVCVWCRFWSWFRVGGANSGCARYEVTLKVHGGGKVSGSADGGEIAGAVEVDQRGHVQRVPAMLGNPGKS